MKEWSTEELVEILVDWHRYAHGGGMIGACNNDKCQAALKEIKKRILAQAEPSEEHTAVFPGIGAVEVKK